MNIVRELIGSHQLMLIAEYLSIIFSQSAKLIVFILQTKICQLDLENNLLTHLRIYGNPNDSRLFCHFLFIVLTSAEPRCVLQHDYKLASEPFFYLLIRLALARALILFTVTLFKKDHERPRGWRIVVTLHFHFVHIKALELSIVKA